MSYMRGASLNNKLEIRKLSFSYNSNKDEQLKDINLDIKDGECCVIIGESGCGKSTLTRAINGLIPNFYEGNLDGEVFIDGKSIRNLKSWEIAKLVGNVFQDPRSQFFANEVNGEIAFGPENLGYKRDEIIRRVNESTEKMNIDKLLNNRIYNLSYGIRQKVAICSARAIEPSIYVFDEPSANLDLQSIYKFSKLVMDLKNEGKTIVIVEHRLFYLKGIADRYLLIQNGSLINSYKAEEFEKISSKDLNALGLRSINLNDIVIDDHKVKEKEISSDNSFDFEVKNISKKYKNNFVLKDVSLKFDSNETIALVGINGTGKSTLGKIYSGIQNQTDGEIKINGLKANKKMRLSKVWYIPQDLDSQLFGEDLMDELLTGLKNREDYITKAEELLKKVGLFDIRDKHPATLSGGQKQRLVLCVAMLRETPFIILDEPTSGLDFRSMDKVGRLIKEEQKKGTKFLIISHDIEFIAKTCDRLVKLENGIITEDFYIDNIGQLLRAMEAK